MSLEGRNGRIELLVQFLHVLSPTLVHAWHVPFVTTLIETGLQPGALLAQLLGQALLHGLHVPSVLLNARLRLLVRLSWVLITEHDFLVGTRTGRIILGPVEVQLRLRHLSHEFLELPEALCLRFHIEFADA